MKYNMSCFNNKIFVGKYRAHTALYDCINDSSFPDLDPVFFSYLYAMMYRVSKILDLTGHLSLKNSISFIFIREFDRFCHCQFLCMVNVCE